MEQTACAEALRQAGACILEEQEEAAMAGQ